MQGPESALDRLVPAMQDFLSRDFDAAVRCLCGFLRQIMPSAEHQREVASLLHPQPPSFYYLRINGDFRSRLHVKQILTSSDEDNPFPKLTLDNSEGYTIHDLKRQLPDNEQLFVLGKFMWGVDASAVNFGDPEPVPGLTCWTGQERGIEGPRNLQDARQTGIQLDEFTVAVPLSENEETHVPPCFSLFTVFFLAGHKTRNTGMRIHFRMARGPATGPNTPPSSERDDYTILDNVYACASNPFIVFSKRSPL
jgi:hypothetical protein